MRLSEAGFVNTPAGKVWYGIAGNNKEATPLIVIHGGPGYPHDYLTPIAKLSDKRRVIFYDQAGCGNSSRDVDKKYWTTKYYFAELDHLIKNLSISEYYLLGQSWGAAIAATHAIKNPLGLKGLVLSDPYLSTPVWMDDVVRLKKKLPKEIREEMDKHEKEGTTDTKEYAIAAKEYIRRFVEGMDKESTESRLSNKKQNNDMYVYMWGNQESVVTGTLSSFDLKEDLHKIKIPTLLVCGKNDEATPEATSLFSSLIKGSQMHVFKKSAHIPFLSERAEYVRVVGKFLDNL